MVDKTIGNLTGIVRPLATDLYEVESVSEGSVKIDHPTMLLGPMLPAISQALGFTSANIVEVEANTLAMRVTLRPDDIAFGADQVFAVSRHMLGAQCAISATTASIGVQGAGNSLANVLSGVWTFSGLALLKKCTVSVVTGAVSGARTVGIIECHLRRVVPMFNTIALTSDILPPQPAGIGAASPTPNYNSLNMQQPLSLMVISQSVAGTPITVSGIESSKALGSAVGGAPSAVGTNIPPTVLFDCVGGGYEPYVMVGNTGFVVSMFAPAAATSQTMNVSVNLQWDEWIPIPMDR